ncbi:phosphorylated adapter RNA export protein-like [Asterias rubens]|uniref:phosphorylated adapter RNA export protein-like n=1 Tax=Asterias rubens TaxID=7604 RepID=UPI0014553D51|nr:phosphorylated adapter RNA export protein-like [Asterias rubens]
MASYRDVTRATNSSDDSGSDTNSDSDDDQPWKRRKQSNQTESKWTGQQSGFDKRGNRVEKSDRGHGLMGAAPGSAAPSSGVKRSKRNNVWGEVVQRQNEDHVAREMDGFNMELSRSRDIESYDYKMGQNSTKRGNLGAPPITKNESLGERELKHGVGETSDDIWLANAHQRLGERDSGRRKTAKARLGSRPKSDYSSSMKFISICPSLSKQEIAGKIAFSLQESKRELIMRVVNAVGVDKALELWKLTADTEKNGGMMTLNGSRRRLPGGVFLFLMKTDPQVTKQQVAEIFAEEKKKETDLKHKKDRHRRKMAAQAKSMEEGEEEFANDAVEETKDTTVVVEESRMDSSVESKVEAAKETKDSIVEGNPSCVEDGEIESGEDKDDNEAPVSKN